MNPDQDSLSIYTNMLAGCVPIGNAEPERVISLICQDILDTTSIHMVFDIKDGYIFYMAVPSKYLASHLKFATSLASAFSSHPQHQGDAVYLLKEPPCGYAMIRRGNTLKLLVNQLDILEESIESAELPVIDVSQFSALPMYSIPLLYRNYTDKIANVVSKAAATMLVATTAVMMVSEMGQAVIALAKIDTPEVILQKANQSIRNAKLSQPLSRQITQVQNVSATVVRAGGWIEEYTLKGNEEKFVIALPTWVSKDYLDSLGKGVTTELQEADNLIWVYKGKPKRIAESSAQALTTRKN